MVGRRWVLHKSAVLGLGILTLSTGCNEQDDEQATELGGQVEVNTVPTAAFRFEYAASSETLTVTHESGAALPVDNVYLRGTGLDQTGPWQEVGGMASGTKDGSPAVISGDELSVGASSDFEARIVWEFESNASSLADETGPEA